MARGPLTADAHPWIVRATHWLNAVLLGIMIASGLEIFSVDGERLATLRRPGTAPAWQPLPVAG